MDPIHRLYNTASKLEDMELELLANIAERLLIGQERYGKLKDNADKKVWLNEAGEELMDGIVYVAMDLMRRGSK